MDRSLFVCLCVLVTLVVLAILSKTVSGDSKLGTYSAATVRKTCDRLFREACHLRAASLQDEAPAFAMGHSAEALSKTRCARALLHEYGLVAPNDLQELEADLRDEQEASLHLLSVELDSGAPQG